MSKSLIRFLLLIMVIVFLIMLMTLFLAPAHVDLMGDLYKGWIVPAEMKDALNCLENGTWQQAWLHLSRSFTIKFYISIVLFVLAAVLGWMLFSGQSKSQQPQIDEKEIEDLQFECNRLGSLGLDHADSGENEKAIGYYMKALAISRKIRDHHGEANTLGNLGNSYQSLGQLEKAIDYHEQSLAIFRKVGDRKGEGCVLGNLGKVHSDSGQLEKAIMYNRQSLTVFEEIRSPFAAQMRIWISELEKQHHHDGT